MLSRQELLSEIDKYCALTGRKASGVATEILNDSKFFANLRKGKDCNTGTIEKVETWLHKNMPSENKISASLTIPARSVNNNL